MTAAGKEDAMTGALGGLRVIDLAPGYGYAGKLFSDLGAEVIVIEPPGGLEARKRHALFCYLNSGKKSVVMDLDAPGDIARLRQLLPTTDIVLDARPQRDWEARGLGYAAVKRDCPSLVWCAITPFGQTGPQAHYKADDAVLMAMGGMASLTGYEDTGPLIADGRLSEYSAAQFAAALALTAVLGRDNTGGGQFIDVSVQEVVLLGTETAPQFYFLQGRARRRRGEDERQAGIGVYPCRDGHVLIYTAEKGVGTGWTRLVDWLVETQTPGAEALRSDEWLDNGFKAKAGSKKRFREIFAAFAQKRGKRDIFEEGQARRIAIAPLCDADDVLADRHFRERGSFAHYGPEGARTLIGPGAPYRFSGARWRAGAAPALGAHNGEILGRIEKPAAWPPAQAKKQKHLPLHGLRIVDFSWVGAGPFTTKLFADLGADVIKIETATRPDQLRRAEPLTGKKGLDESAYFAARNTNKSSITLDMTKPGARALILRMARDADVMVNSFSPNVMPKFGLAYEDVAAVNDRIVYLSMPMAGDDGPYRDFLGYGMSIAALIGLYRYSALDGRLPVGTGTNFPDHIPNPMHACFALLAALHQRRRTHKGQKIVLSQIDSSLAVYPERLLQAGSDGLPEPVGRHIYRCAGEDRWCAISLNGDADLAALGPIVGSPGLSSGAAEDAIAAWTRKRDPHTVMAELQDAGIAAGVVQTPEDYLERDIHLRERQFWQYLEHPAMGRSLYHGIPAKLSETSTRYRRGAPLLGEHNDRLKDLCALDEPSYRRLRQDGVIR